MFSSDNKYWEQFFSDDMTTTSGVASSEAGFRLKSPGNAPLAQRRMGPQPCSSNMKRANYGTLGRQLSTGDSGFSGYQQQQQQQHQQQHDDDFPTTQHVGNVTGIVRPVEHPGYSSQSDWMDHTNDNGAADNDVCHEEAGSDSTILLDGGDFDEPLQTSTPAPMSAGEKVFILRPDMAFKDHNVEADGIGVFYDEDGDLVMEVGIDRILRFTYRGGEEIEGYRCVPTVGGPADHHVSVTLQRWAKMLEVEEHINAQVQEIFGGNGAETRIHLGGLYFMQISKRFSNVQIRQYSVPNNNGQKVYATKFGISMSIPEYFYFSNLVRCFSSRIEKLQNLVPCYRNPQHSATCIECFPLKKHEKRVERRAGSSSGGGRQYVGAPEKRPNVNPVNPQPTKWPRLIKQPCVSGSGNQSGSYFKKA